MLGYIVSVYILNMKIFLTVLEKKLFFLVEKLFENFHWASVVLVDALSLLRCEIKGALKTTELVTRMGSRYWDIMGWLDVN